MTTSDLKAEATRLRQLGHTYPEISQLLNGAVSVDWCKKSLKGVVKGDKDTDCIKELLELATRPEGVSVYEANGVIMKHNEGNMLTTDQLRYKRNKVKALDKSSMFRPDWVSTKQPSNSYQSFCAYVLHMQDEIDNLVRWYCDTYPDTKPNAVKYELLEYLKPESKIHGRLDKAEKVVEALEQRLCTY